MTAPYVPEEFQSKTPALLRKLVESQSKKISPATVKLLSETALEIEGSEDAYAALVAENRILREKLQHTERNLQATIKMIPAARI